MFLMVTELLYKVGGDGVSPPKAEFCKNSSNGFRICTVSLNSMDVERVLYESSWTIDCMST